jgi:hypothetical protein
LTTDGAVVYKPDTATRGERQMNQRLLRSLCVVSVCVSSGCASPPEQMAVSEAARAELTARQKSAFAAIFAGYRSILLTGRKTCTTDCDVTINLEMVTVTLADGTAKDFCVATLPETLEFPGTPGGVKTITWKLSTSVVGGMPVEFHEKHGILTIDDASSQLNPDNQRTDKITFKAKNKHSVRNSQATYVPVIIRFVNGLPEVCGTADPKIINL